MNEDAFARRFYADRAELESLRIPLTVEKPLDGVAEQENYSLRPENFHLPRDRILRLRARRAGDGAFAARRRVRLRRAAAARAAADHLGPPEPARGARPARRRARHHRLGRRPRALAAPREDRDRDLPPQDDHLRLLHDGARRDRRRARSIPTTCSTAAASSTCSATPTSARRCASSACRGSAARSPTRRRPSTTSAARPTSTRAPTPSLAEWQFGEIVGTAEIRIAERIAWQLERHFGRYGEVRAIEGSGDRLFVTDYSSARQLISWVLGLGENARVIGPPELGGRAGAPRRAARSSATRNRPRAARARAERRGPRRAATATATDRSRAGRRDPPRALRAARHPRLDPDPGRPRRAGGSSSTEVCARLQITEAELREDIGVLNVVNFGGGSYVLYAEIDEDDGTIDVDPEPYSDNFARPARLLPVEAKALVAAIDLIGEHLPQGSLTRARDEDRRGAGRGSDGAGPPGRPRAAATTPIVSRVDLEGDQEARAARPRLLQGERGRVLGATRRALCADQRPRGLVRRDLRPGKAGRAPLPARPDQARRGDKRALRAPARGQPVGRRRRLAADRRGQRVAQRARLDLARAGALGARAAQARRRARTTARSPSS